jgi:hypothetical protein
MRARHPHHGFTQFKLMIVIAIVAILLQSSVNARPWMHIVACLFSELFVAASDPDCRQRVG